jgi:hypothetical protein
MKSSAIRRRVLPFTPLELMLQEPGGGHYKLELNLAFDMNAAAAIQEKTADPRAGVEIFACKECGTLNELRPFRGFMLTNFATFAHISEPRLLRVMLWAAMLAHQPEYDSDEGLRTVGTFIQESNAEQIVEAIQNAYFAFLPAHKVDAIKKLIAEKESKGAGAETKSPLEEMKAANPETNGSSSGPLPDMTFGLVKKSSVD